MLMVENEKTAGHHGTTVLIAQSGAWGCRIQCNLAGSGRNISRAAQLVCSRMTTMALARAAQGTVYEMSLLDGGQCR
jgi:hypothetical protein